MTIATKTTGREDVVWPARSSGTGIQSVAAKGSVIPILGAVNAWAAPEQCGTRAQRQIVGGIGGHSTILLTFGYPPDSFF
jgi:hypothetical protein